MQQQHSCCIYDVTTMTIPESLITSFSQLTNVNWLKPHHQMWSSFYDFQQQYITINCGSIVISSMAPFHWPWLLQKNIGRWYYTTSLATVPTWRHQPRHLCSNIGRGIYETLSATVPTQENWPRLLVWDQKIRETRERIYGTPRLQSRIQVLVGSICTPHGNNNKAPRGQRVIFLLQWSYIWPHSLLLLRHSK